MEQSSNRITTIKNKIEKVISRFTEILQESPIEVLVSLFTFIYAAGVHEKIITDNVRYSFLMPLFFAFSFIINRIFVGQKHRLVYYLSLLPFFLFWWIDVQVWVVSVGYTVALIIAALAILSFKQKKDNKKFAVNAIQYLSEFISSLFLMSTAYGLIISIYFSLNYIFNITESHEYFWTYSSLFIFIIGWPLTFLMLHKEEITDIEDSGLFNILFNYLISPALLIYTGILYLYFVKILVLWSLPKGGVAYMVFAFIFVAVTAGACQPLLKKQPYNWFYNYFSFISLPALLMFWTGVVYRVQQYGLTDDRVYLLVCGAIMTICIGLFFTKQLGHYLYVTWIAIFLLACFTYIPGITAKDLGIYSQTNRLNKAIKELNLIIEDGKLQRTEESGKDEYSASIYKILYDSYRYLRYEYDEDYMYNHYGYKYEEDLKNTVIPAELHSYIDGDTVEVSAFETIYYPEESIDISNYRYLYDNDMASSIRDSIFINTGKTEFNESLEQVLNRQLQKIGYNAKNVSLDSIKAKAKEFLTIETDLSTIILKDVNMEMDKDNGTWKINYINNVIVLEK